ncbi:MAG TPA: selenoneine biosynthesis selenosugar synthase SenB [Burkholderiales bacterium]|nr:selenoneine biosynthesis selenosugar synthase SenB [Burkholderiales bacterium]
MKISMITPAGARTRNGNRNTATRWAGFLRAMGHRVTVAQHWEGVPSDLMIALHARRSYDSIAAFAHAHPQRPLVVALTGTDLYRDIHTDHHAQHALALATRLIVLQDMGPQSLPGQYRAKTRVVYQSARSIASPPPHLQSCFEVVVSGHLREEKDPFRAAWALALLPKSTRIRVTHIGRAMTLQMQTQAETLAQNEPRYRWLGEYPHWKALRVLARSRLMVLSSIMEGGANVASEALALNVPVIASRIDGNIGMLGRDYPGYYTVRDERMLADCLNRAETDPAWYARLREACAARAHLVSAQREQAALRALMEEL